MFWEHGNRECSELTYAISQGASASEVEAMLKKGTPVKSDADQSSRP